MAGPRVLIYNTGGADGDTTARSFTLPTARTGQEGAFLLVGGRLQELNWYRPQFGSWFAAESVIQDGGCYLATPVDPLYVVLPLLEECRQQSASSPGVFCELDQILAHSSCAAFALLAECVRPSLPCVCDVKTIEGQDYYRLSDHRVVAWLCCKAAQASGALREDSPAAFGGLDARSMAAYSAGLIAEYVAEHWHQRLLAALGVAADSAPCGGATGAAQSPALPLQVQNGPPEMRPEKRAKFDPKEAAKRKAAEQRAEARATQLARETSGMRKMTSFFVKPKQGA